LAWEVLYAERRAKGVAHACEVWSERVALCGGPAARPQHVSKPHIEEASGTGDAEQAELARERRSDGTQW
jgi:hypothetical protein